jgi:hypothetical protein
MLERGSENEEIVARVTACDIGKAEFVRSGPCRARTWLASVNDG